MSFAFYPCVPSAWHQQVLSKYRKKDGRKEERREDNPLMRLDQTWTMRTRAQGRARSWSPSIAHSLPATSSRAWAPAPSASSTLEAAHEVVSIPAGLCLLPIRMQGNDTAITDVRLGSE